MYQTTDCNREITIFEEIWERNISALGRFDAADLKVPKAEVPSIYFEMKRSWSISTDAQTSMITTLATDELTTVMGQSGSVTSPARWACLAPIRDPTFIEKTKTLLNTEHFCKNDQNYRFPLVSDD